MSIKKSRQNKKNKIPYLVKFKFENNANRRKLIRQSKKAEE